MRDLLPSEFRFLHGKTPGLDSFAEILQFRDVYYFGGTSASITFLSQFFQIVENSPL